jgi:hypothetical protein
MLYAAECTRSKNELNERSVLKKLYEHTKGTDLGGRGGRSSLAWVASLKVANCPSARYREGLPLGLIVQLQRRATLVPPDGCGQHFEN